MRAKIPLNVMVVAFVAFFSGIGQDLIAPILPAYLVSIGFDRSGIGLIDGLLQGTTYVFRFISGILSDYFRKRKSFVFLGYTLSSIARPLLAFFNSFFSIALLRVFDGAGKGLKDAPRDALVADSSAKEIHGRSFGFHRLIDTLGSVIGPMIAAGTLFILGTTLNAYRTIFLFAAIPGALALILIWIGIREPARQEVEVKKISFKSLNWQFWIFTIGTSILMLTKLNDSLLLVRASEVIKVETIPILFAGFTLVYALLSYPIGILSDKIGKIPFILAGWLVLFFVELGFVFFHGIIAIIILFIFYGLFFALTEGSGRAYIADVVSSDARGSAYAIFNTFIGIAVIGGGYFLGKLWDVYGLNLAFKISSLGLLIGFLILLIFLILRRNKLKQN